MICCLYIYVCVCVINARKKISELMSLLQEKLVMKDFDIKKEANGVDKVVITKFDKVQVKNNILEIRFHWSGKGTTAVPKRGTYGSLISAISMESGKLLKFFSDPLVRTCLRIFMLVNETLMR